MDVILHEKTRRLVENYLKQEDKGGVLLIGEKGSGKERTAKEMAASILNCKTDMLIHHEDFFEFPRESEKINVDEIKVILELGALRTSGKHKVFLIKNSNISVANQNKLLKLLEDSGEKNIVIFTSNRDIFIKTIKSRCQSIDFLPLSDEKMKEILLNEGIKKEYIPMITYLKNNRPYQSIKSSFYIQIYSDLLKIKCRAEIFQVLHMVRDKDEQHYFDMVGTYPESIRLFTFLFINILYHQYEMKEKSEFLNISRLYSKREVTEILDKLSLYISKMDINTKKNDFFDLVAKMVIDTRRRY